MPQYRIVDKKGNQGWISSQNVSYKPGDLIWVFMPHNNRFLRFFAKLGIISPFKRILVGIAREVLSENPM